MVCLFSTVYMTELIHSYPKLEQELFQFDTSLAFFVYRVVQILGIVLFNFFLDIFQMSPISYHNTHISMSKLNHNLC